MMELIEAKKLISEACGYGDNYTCIRTRFFEGNDNKYNCCGWCKQRETCTLETEPSQCLAYACRELRDKIIKSEELLQAWAVLQVEALKRLKQYG